MKKPITLEEALIMIEQQQAEIFDLREKRKEIQAYLGLNQKTSSFLSSQRPALNKLKKLGTDKHAGQKGHPGAFREALPCEAVDTIVTCPPPAYCSCGAVLAPNGEYVAQPQQVLPEIRIEIVEFQRQKAVCTRCARTHVSPSGTAPGLSDSRLFEQLFGLKIAPSTLSQQARYLLTGSLWRLRSACSVARLSSTP